MRGNCKLVFVWLWNFLEGGLKLIWPKIDMLKGNYCIGHFKIKLKSLKTKIYLLTAWCTLP